MSICETIYTSCRIGIEGSNSGLQVYSRSVEQCEPPEQITRFFGYDYPRTLGAEPTIDEIKAKCPVKFECRILDNGRVALAGSSYIGRDYMGGLGRYGNYINHVITADQADFEYYPAEYYKSAMFRESLSPGEANRTDTPPYLPRLGALIPGEAVSIRTIRDFLAVGERMEVFKTMLAALLDAMQGTQRIVIVDDKENIMQWIGALQMAFPIKNAMSIPFSSYEFQPESSYAKVCGALNEGTIFSVQSAQINPKILLFDCINQSYPVAEANRYTPFLAAVEMSYSMFDGYLDPFHDFVDKYGYKEAGSPIFGAYLLYMLLEQGADAISAEQMKEAIEFSGRYGGEQGRERLVDGILRSAETLRDPEFDQTEMLVAFLCDSISAAKNEVRKGEMLEHVQKLFISLLSGNFVKESPFRSLFSKAGAAMAGQHIDLKLELLYNARQSLLIEKMDVYDAPWKFAFILDLLAYGQKTDSLKPSDMTEASPEYAVLKSLITNLQRIDSKSGGDKLSDMVRTLGVTPGWLVFCACAVEHVLGEAIQPVWNTVYQCAAEQSDNFIALVCDNLFKLRYFEHFHAIFKLRLSSLRSGADSFFERCWNRYILGDPDYRNQYADTSVRNYIEILDKWKGTARQDALKSLFALLKATPVDTAIMEALVNMLTAGLPLSKPDKSAIYLIRDILTYCSNNPGQYDLAKAILLQIGIELRLHAEEPNAGRNRFDIRSIVGGYRPECHLLGVREFNAYRGWVLPAVCLLCNTAGQYSNFLDCMGFSTAQRIVIIGEMTDEMLRIAAREKQCCCIYMLACYCKEYGTYKEEDAFVSRLADSSNKVWETINQQIPSLADTKSRQQYWNEIADAVYKRRSSSISGRFKNLFLKKDNDRK